MKKPRKTKAQREAERKAEEAAEMNRRREARKLYEMHQAKWAKVKREAAEKKARIRQTSRATMGLIAVNEGRRGKRAV